MCFQHGFCLCFPFSFWHFLWVEMGHVFFRSPVCTNNLQKGDPEVPMSQGSSPASPSLLQSQESCSSRAIQETFPFCELAPRFFFLQIVWGRERRSLHNIRPTGSPSGRTCGVGGRGDFSPFALDNFRAQDQSEDGSLRGKPNHERSIQRSEQAGCYTKLDPSFRWWVEFGRSPNRAFLN